MTSSLILLLVLIPVTIAQSNSLYCPTGSTYEDRCLAMNYPSAFLRDTDECIIVIEDKNARASSVDSACSSLGKLSGFDGTPFRKQSNEQIKEIESYFALRQGGGHYFGEDRIDPTNKNGNGAEGYICAFKDKCTCQSGWNRYKDHCYKAFDREVEQADAAGDCEDADAKLAQIRDDEDNKFIALLAQKTFFKDSNKNAIIWGSLGIVDQEWKHMSDVDNGYTDKVLYMRWWADKEGIEPVTKNGKGQTIYCGNSDEKQNNKFGYWGTARQTDKYRYVCYKKMSKVTNRRT